MQITDIKAQKNSDHRFSVFVEGKFAVSLTQDELLAYGIKKNISVSSADLDRLKQVSNDSKLLSRTYEKCLRRPHSEKEIRDYLRTRKATNELIDYIVEKCKSKNVLDDEYFARRWLEHRATGNRSARHIRQELKMKGISDQIIESLDFSSDKAALREQIKKRQGKYDDQSKLVAYLQRKGFNYSDIKAELASFKDE